ncbi:MAG TPA: B12-binding domain-containing radical SAM protein [Bacteroidales bacterium]|nr:MAG: B12-binding domain-containing radical SAM protein [Bacteroidetes bacterium GWE2_42_24]OFY28848.1 MAG: B12-binding domain-containing radical SAM protein [Bacteroidetes bacterium GWF2_43_11]HAQ65851.1 B12-binding domain-containing radical SAM protein [Bacteroidales bacterium]HBZ67681.1 B12-binding domain-containing radical SAM protein [Bacteroidales bacterium]
MSQQKTYTLLLVYPANQLRQGFLVNRDTRYQPLALGILAALTPSNWKIKLIDENFRRWRYYDADLVALTSFTSSVTRAYQIAGEYRKKGIPTVIGGIHASMMPDEAAQYVDVVVTGEAEGVWPKLITDFENGTLQKRYDSILSPIIHSPKPRRDLFHPGYIFASIQTTRGCPMDCSFCSVTAFNGRHYRFRPIDEVLDEFEEIPQQYVFILDDNIVGYNTEARERAKELFRGIIKRGIKKTWISQASINFADDEEVLQLAAASGCRMIFLGIETEGIEQLQEAGKKLNLKRGADSYNDTFKAIRRHGIAVIAGFIFGFDHDDEEAIKRRVKYIRNCQADSIQTTLLTPLPGTRLFNKFREEGRLRMDNFPEDWQRYDYADMTFNPTQMDGDAFMYVMEKAFTRIYSPLHIIRRFFRTLTGTRNLMTAFWSYRSNHNYRNMAACSFKKL